MQINIDDKGARVARWETAREIPDPAEFERAIVARSAARGLIVKECCSSSFGLLCPMANEGALFDAIEGARRIADEFNSGAALSRIGVYALVGRVASDDLEAARAIGAEVRELLEAMRAGIAAADPEAIRAAAAKAKAIGGMLSADVAGQVSAAIKEARSAAREIVRRVEKAGETAAAVVAECNTGAIDAARFAFLDLDDGGDRDVSSVTVGGRGIDLEAAPVEVYAAPDAGAPRSLELF